MGGTVHLSGIKYHYQHTYAARGEGRENRQALLAMGCRRGKKSACLATAEHAA